MTLVRHSPRLVLLCLFAQLAFGANGPAQRHFKVDSEPEGAEVYVITGRAGTTPLFVSERDIYPNRYPEEKQDLYGRVIIRKPGCAEFSKRITRDDIRRGLTAHLECEPQPTRADANRPRANARPSAPSPRTVSDVAAGDETPAQRRLRQLRVIEELTDEGLLEPEQARTIRRRILQAD